MAAQAPSSEDQEKRAVVQRIADSAGFRSAARLRDFLLFVTDLALSGRAAEISEQRIGHEVFHRSADYDTASDNIVRVSARQLRIKLREYADREGASDAWTIEIPKGGYLPVFTRREAASSAARPVPLWRWKAAAALCALLALAASGAYLHVRLAVGHGDESPLTNLIIHPGERTTVVLADSTMVLLHAATGHLMTADEYAMRRPPPAPQDPVLGDLTRSIFSQQITSIAGVEFALRLLRSRPDASDRIAVVHARNIGPRNLKEGNVILIGGPRSNPWASLFEDRLNYRFDFSGEQPASRLINSRPRPGEPAFYENDRRDGVVTKSFARIALVPNLDNSGRVLLLSGATIEGTEAATEFFFGRHSTARLAQALGRAPSTANGFEVLLETTAIDGTARSSRIVGARDLL